MHFPIAFVLLALASLTTAWKLSIYEHPNYNKGDHKSKRKSNFVGATIPGDMCVDESKFGKLKHDISSLQFWPENESTVKCQLYVFAWPGCWGHKGKREGLTAIHLGAEKAGWPQLRKKPPSSVYWRRKRWAANWDNKISSFWVQCGD
jgi:hypothetical protein